jgi:hypothetical protein
VATKTNGAKGPHKLEIVMNGVPLMVYHTAFSHVGRPRICVAKYHIKWFTFRVTHYIENPQDLIEAGFRNSWYAWRHSEESAVVIKFYEWAERETFYRKQGGIVDPLKKRMVTLAYNTRAETLMWIPLQW